MKGKKSKAMGKITHAVAQGSSGGGSGKSAGGTACMATGGGVKGRLDKKGRGKAMTPSSPLSGAACKGAPVKLGGSPDKENN